MGAENIFHAQKRAIDLHVKGAEDVKKYMTAELRHDERNSMPEKKRREIDDRAYKALYSNEAHRMKSKKKKTGRQVKSEKVRSKGQFHAN